MAVYEYLAGMTGIGEGLYLLRAIEILTRVVCVLFIHE